MNVSGVWEHCVDESLLIDVPSLHFGGEALFVNINLQSCKLKSKYSANDIKFLLSSRQQNEFHSYELRHEF